MGNRGDSDTKVQVRVETSTGKMFKCHIPLGLSTGEGGGGGVTLGIPIDWGIKIGTPARFPDCKHVVLFTFPKRPWIPSRWPRLACLHTGAAYFYLEHLVYQVRCKSITLFYVVVILILNH